MLRTRGPNAAKIAKMTISVITFDLDNTLWDVEPALIKAEQVQQQWLLQYRPGAVDAFDREALFEF